MSPLIVLAVADRDGIAARHRDLFLVVPFEAVARRDGVGGGGQLEALPVTTAIA